MSLLICPPVGILSTSLTPGGDKSLPDTVTSVSINCEKVLITVKALTLTLYVFVWTLLNVIDC